MEFIKFVKFDPTPDEKHIGIATVSYANKIILRYKIVPMKDGKSFFPAAASMKMPETAGADAYYVPSFTIESFSENEFITQLIRSHVKNHLEKSQSVHKNTHELEPFASIPSQQTHQQFTFLDGIDQVHAPF